MACTPVDKSVIAKARELFREAGDSRTGTEAAEEICKLFLECGSQDEKECTNHLWDLKTRLQRVVDSQSEHFHKRQPSGDSGYDCSNNTLENEV